MSPLFQSIIGYFNPPSAREVDQFYYQRPPPGAKGFGSFVAWKQEETYMFFALHVFSAVAAFIIAARDAGDKRARRKSDDKVNGEAVQLNGH
jgi:hypothetical protein